MFELRSILCGSELSQQNEDVLCHALKLALLGRCELLLAHADRSCKTHLGRRVPELRERLVRWGVLDADAPVDALDALGLRTSVVHLPGAPETSLAQLVERRRPDLMVLGTEQRRGVGRWMHPSTAEAMAHVPRVPTLLVPTGAGGLVSAATGDLRLGRVLVPMASWPDASLAAQLAQRLASTLGLKHLHYRTLYVGSRAEVPTLDRMRDNALWEHENRQGSVVETILDEADNFGADLVAVATQGHRGLGDRLFGNTVERVIRRVGCPVLVAPST